MTLSKPDSLIVESEARSGSSLSQAARDEGFEVLLVRTLQAGFRCLDRRAPSVLLANSRLPDGSGSRLLVHPNSSRSHVFLVSSNPSVRAVVDAMRAGAEGYFEKPVDPALLRRHLHDLARPYPDGSASCGLHGESMRPVIERIRKVAGTQAMVLITGASGTGKELVARAIHRLSERREGSFVAVNCGALSPNLAESELFGHERGSFTGASRKRRGLFLQAEGGTLLLDEITEMPPELQVKLLRVLETDSLMPVGAERSIATDVRVLAACNRDPEQAVREGKLRPDLFYRLNVFGIHLPPLQERGADVEVLADTFLREIGEEEGREKHFGRPVMDLLRRWPWPGNVRELRNVVRSAYIIADDVITADCLPERMLCDGPAPAGEGSVRIPLGSSLGDAERSLILATLEQLGGDKPAAAQVLGMSLKTLYNRLHRYGASGPWLRRRRSSRKRVAGSRRR